MPLSISTPALSISVSLSLFLFRAGVRSLLSLTVLSFLDFTHHPFWGPLDLAESRHTGSWRRATIGLWIYEVNGS